ncbi:MAG TPA: SDR family NAD(P)-dependent oxidoreductase [Thermoleophilaceae bacterium]
MSDTDVLATAPFDLGEPLTAEWMTGRTALVTGGGSRGADHGSVGWAISRVLARHGARVGVVDVDRQRADRTVSEIADAGGSALTVIADVCSDQDCRRAVRAVEAELGPVDTLVNNVAAWSPEELFEVEPERFDELFELNLKTAWLMSRHAAERMSAGGAIVNIASLAARRPGTVYGLAKASLEAMTAGAAHLLAERGVRVNAVELGALWTAAVAANLPAEAREQRLGMVALGTEGTCWDAAAAVLFLASHRARWISGQVLSVDGGGPPRMPYPGVSRG